MTRALRTINLCTFACILSYRFVRCCVIITVSCLLIVPSFPSFYCARSIMQYGAEVTLHWSVWVQIVLVYYTVTLLTNCNKNISRETRQYSVIARMSSLSIPLHCKRFHYSLKLFATLPGKTVGTFWPTGINAAVYCYYYYYYYAAFNALCVGHKDDESQAPHYS